jgi:pimeloyl-ACP methyl ester carboxylesterase
MARASLTPAPGPSLVRFRILLMLAFLWCLPGGAALAQGVDSSRTASGLWFAAQGQGPAIVLVHGSNVDSRSFDWIAAPLAAGHRVVAMDLRFHGKSRDSGGPVSWEGDLLEVMDAARVERAVGGPT